MTSAFGEYELLNRVGQGRLTLTHRARARAGGPDVALKTLLPHVANDPAFVQKFAAEAKAAVALPAHAHLAQVLDVGQVGHTHYFTTEWVAGQPLGALLDRARKKGLPVLPTPIALQIAIALCQALGHLHGLKAADNRALKLVHREVGPESVLLGYDGAVKLTDLLLGPSRGASKSEMGVLKGKFPYFSPEQARSEELDRRSDVFAVGALLFHMLCGKKPFDGELFDALPKMLKAEYPAPRGLNNSLPLELETVLATALSPSREGRYASMQDFEAALTSSMDLSFDRAFGSRFVQWLFAVELAQEGRPPGYDAAFEAWLSPWLIEQSPATIRVASLAEPVPPDMAVTDEVKRPGPAPSAITELAVRPVPARAAPVASKKSRFPMIAIAGGLLVGAGLWVGKLAMTGENALVVTSTPEGARVTIDGAPQAGATPFTLHEVKINQPITVLVELPGHLPWKGQVALVRGKNAVHAQLAPQPK